ncbi:MAG: hypothetical protein M3Q38_07375 [Chloroflexota bacterium]|nr:hypothetical protein [Chloroflexota bacterium]
MDDAAILLQIRVIAVSTRAAVHSLKPADPQVARVVQRGLSLLERLAPVVLEHGSGAVKLTFEQTCLELASLDGNEAKGRPPS